jgi:hypothetical protein
MNLPKNQEKILPTKTSLSSVFCLPSMLSRIPSRFFVEMVRIPGKMRPQE